MITYFRLLFGLVVFSTLANSVAEATPITIDELSTTRPNFRRVTTALLGVGGGNEVHILNEPEDTPWFMQTVIEEDSSFTNDSVAVRTIWGHNVGPDPEDVNPGPIRMVNTSLAAMGVEGTFSAFASISVEHPLMNSSEVHWDAYSLLITGQVTLTDSGRYRISSWQLTERGAHRGTRDEALEAVGVVPEPSTLALVSVVTLTGLVYGYCRRRKRAA